MKIVEAMIKRMFLMNIFYSLSTIAQSTNFFSNLCIVRRYHPRITTGAKIFGRVKAEPSGVSESANAIPFIHRTMGLACILNHNQVIFFSNS